LLDPRSSTVRASLSAGLFPLMKALAPPIRLVDPIYVSPGDHVITGVSFAVGGGAYGGLAGGHLCQRSGCW
jgi:hypothetical protein